MCSAGAIDYRGYLNDPRPAMADCQVYVLPSYREGMPRSVLEAMSMGRPIITTNAPGCRETVVLTERGRKQLAAGDRVMEGINGYMVQPRDVGALRQAFALCLQAPGRLVDMGRASHDIACNRFDAKKVNAQLLDAMGLA